MGRSLMDHVAGRGNAIEFAVKNILMEPCRLLIDVDDPISLTCDNDDGNLKSVVPVTKFDRTRYHQCCVTGAGPDL